MILLLFFKFAFLQKKMNHKKNYFSSHRRPPCRNGPSVNVGATGPSSPSNGNNGIFSRSKFEDSSNSSSPKPAFVTSDFAGCCGGQFSNGSGKYQTSVTNGRQDRQVVQVNFFLSIWHFYHRPIFTLFFRDNYILTLNPISYPKMCFINDLLFKCKI